MEGGIDGAVDALKDLLNSPDAAKTIESMLGSIGIGTDTPAPKADMPALQPEKLMQVMQAYKSIGDSPDNRVTLLRAVRPFLRDSRRSNVDTAIQLLTVMRILPLLGEFKDLL
ncbi:MAG: hypothetical protein IJD83_05855 [Clostridia bacterium]|nr:hypothetical protein [Clostridia bacterium]